MNGTHKCGLDADKHGKGPGCPNIATEHKGIKKCEVSCKNKLNNNNYDFPYINSEYLHLTCTHE